MYNETHPVHEPIRITREEAMSSKVDDFLSRQKSLTGDPGISRDPKQKVWYLQNWLLFGLAGALAAFAVWAALEPYYDDYLYIQGRIQNMDLEAPIPEEIKIGMLSFEPGVAGQGWIRVNDERIWLPLFVMEYKDGETLFPDPEQLQIGHEVGVYVEYTPLSGAEGFALAHYLVLSPASPPPNKAKLSLAKLYKRDDLIGFLLFPFVAGAIGLLIGAVEGLLCRLLRRAVIAGLIGMLVGTMGGFLLYLPTNLIYNVFTTWASEQAQEAGIFTTFALFVQMCGRALSWSLMGMAMGLGQGIALKSNRLLLYGFLGGVIGGLLGGLLFDPIQFFIQGSDAPSAHWSRMVGFTVIGLSVGVLIGVVQLLARDVWLRMTHGPLAGKEFLFFKDVMTVGASQQCEIYLFNDPHVLPRHATLRTIGEECEIESLSRDKPVLLNDRSIRRSRLRHGDRITIGRTSFVFQMKQR